MEDCLIMNYLTVDIYNDFKCIADACPNTCCVNWQIIIDIETYIKMINKENELKMPAKEWLKEENGIIYVKHHNQKCPMLTKNNLCNVVLKLGPQYLCETCRSYPRASKQYGGFIEEYLVMSCPEVIAQLLRSKTVEIIVSKDNLPSPDYPYTNLYFFEVNVRTHILEILKSSQNVSLGARLLLAFTVLNQSIQMYQNGQLDIDLFEHTCLQTNNLRFIEEQLTSTPVIQRYHVLKQILNTIPSDVPDYHFNELLQNAVQYMNKNNFDQYKFDCKIFNEIVCCSYQNFYTNYWTYRIFSEVISIPDYEHSREMFIYIAVGFALIQTIALVSYTNNDRLDKNDYIYIISYLDRLLEHHSSFRKQLLTIIAENKLINAAGLLLFIIS